MRKVICFLIAMLIAPYSFAEKKDSNPVPIFPKLSVKRRAVALQVLTFAEHDPWVLARVVGMAGFSQLDLSQYLMNQYAKTKWAISKEEAEMVKTEVVKEFDRMLKRRCTAPSLGGDEVR